MSSTRENTLKPLRRLRRLRRTEAMRELVRETHVSLADLIHPLF
ncbi:MAG: porphobilinogen synthase, partial [Shewanella sp.]